MRKPAFGSLTSTVYFWVKYSVAILKSAGFVSPSRTKTTRVVLASEFDATKLVGAPSRDVKSDAGSGSTFALADAGSGAGAVFATRWIDEHAPTLNATNASRITELRRLVYRSGTMRRVTMTLLSTTANMMSPPERPA